MAEPAPAEELTMDDWLAADAASFAEPEATVDTEALASPPPAPAETAPPETAPDLPSPGPAAVVHDAHWEEVNTKLDLARAYEEMGDLEGARELLQEVQAEGSDDLVAQAAEMMERIGR
jgi:pilus assembly protein FimV